MLFSILLIIVGLFVTLKLYLKLKTEWCSSYACLNGKTVIVTGANTGIGYITALDFAKRGAKVIIACRNQEKGLEARNKIVKETNNNNVIAKLLDTSSLASVRAFVEDVKNMESKLDILVNNAGAGGLADRTTKDGLEQLMQVNYFGPFLLTILLLDLLKKSPASRIINVSSLAAKYIHLDVDLINKYQGSSITYAYSKLCNILFTMELAKRLKETNVTVYSLHPGVIETDIFRRIKGRSKVVFNFVASIYFKTPEEGAQTTLYTALTSGLEKHTGGHFSECKLVPTYPSAEDPELSKKLWQKTIEILNIAPEVVPI